MLVYRIVLAASEKYALFCEIMKKKKSGKIYKSYTKEQGGSSFALFRTHTQTRKKLYSSIFFYIISIDPPREGLLMALFLFYPNLIPSLFLLAVMRKEIRYIYPSWIVIQGLLSALYIYPLPNFASREDIAIARRGLCFFFFFLQLRAGHFAGAIA